MPEEKITYEKVHQGVEDIRNCANTMEEIFNNVTGNVRTMTETENFQGVASNTFSGEFDEFKATFPDYVQKVRDFADAYEAARQVLKEQEDQLTRRAEELEGGH